MAFPCDGCGQPKSELRGVYGQPGMFCRDCRKPPPVESNALLNVKFCNGNPGHGNITEAYKRQLMSVELHSDGAPGKHHPEPKVRPRYFV